MTTVHLPMDSLDSARSEGESTEFSDYENNYDLHVLEESDSQCEYNKFYGAMKDDIHEGDCNNEIHQLQVEHDTSKNICQRFNFGESQSSEICSSSSYKNEGEINEILKCKFSNEAKQTCDCKNGDESDVISGSGLTHESKLEKASGACEIVCDHRYEVGVVLVSTSSKYVRLVGSLGGFWLETCVDPVKSFVFKDGVRITEVQDNIEVGTMGHMVLTECVRCLFQEGINDMAAIAVPCLIWFGYPTPAVRGVMGKVVGKKGERMVVQLDGPPAARVVRLVLFYLESIVHREILMETKVKVWAWSRHHQVTKRGSEKFLEGAAVTKGVR